MTALQLAFESRLLVRSVRSDPNFDNVMFLLKSSTQDDLATSCPATDASLLFYAAQRKNDVEAEQICRYLIEDAAACDPAKSDRNSQTALFFAARDGNARCLKYLISKGCNPDHRDSAIQTALFYAARDGMRHCVESLLESGADVNAVDHLGQTALFYAARDGRLETVALMLQKGASTSVKDRQRRTALYYAQKSNQRELVALLKSGPTGSITPTRKLSQTVEGAQTLPSLVADSEACSPDGAPPAKRPRLESHETSPHLTPSSSSTTATLPLPPCTPLSSSSVDPTSRQPVTRRCYRLVMIGFPSTDPEFQSISAPNDQIARFESLAPTIAVWPKTSPSPVSDIYYDIRLKWQTIADSIMDDLSALEGGWIFAKPVDCKAWGCPDYYEVIKNPMDYSTIRKKMKNQQYKKCPEYLSDMNLIFANCFRYNKPDSPVASIGRNIEKVFRELLHSKELQLWIDRENIIEQWFMLRKGENHETGLENRRTREQPAVDDHRHDWRQRRPDDDHQLNIVESFLETGGKHRDHNNTKLRDDLLNHHDHTVHDDSEDP